MAMKSQILRTKGQTNSTFNEYESIDGFDFSKGTH